MAGSVLFPIRDPTNDEIVLLRSRGIDHSKDKLQVACTVGFGNVDIVGGKPAVSILNQLSSLVETIVLAIEAECRKLGFAV